MDIITNVGRKITAAAKTVTRRSEDMVEITKLNLAISSKEDKIKRIFYEIGSELYRSYTNEKSPGELFDTKCGEVKQLEEDIRALKERILVLKGNKVCKTCNLVVSFEVNYCPNCGGKMENKEE